MLQQIMEFIKALASDEAQSEVNGYIDSIEHLGTLYGGRVSDLYARGLARFRRSLLSAGFKNDEAIQILCATLNKSNNSK